MRTTTFGAAWAFCKEAVQWEHYQLCLSENNELSARTWLKEGDKRSKGTNKGVSQ